ncbi:MAG: TolC family protein, partial [Cytophagia bacterium]|nr:TolC family protein [Cytophagia bacterium]
MLAWLDSGLRNNQDVKQTFARISLANADVKLARGNFLPQLNLTTAAGMQRFGDYTVDGVGNFDTNLSDNITPDRRIPEHIPDLYLGLQAQWEADIWGKLKNRKKAAVARYLSSTQAWNDSRLLLLYHIAERYYQLQTLDYKLKVTQENELLQVRALELIRAQKQAGVVTELAVKQFEAQTLNTKALAFNLQREIRQVEYEFNLLTGTMPAPVERTSLSITDQFLKVNTLITPEQILKIRPDV